VILDLQHEQVEVDCLWRKARLIVELDGRRSHDTSSGFEEDRARDRLLIAARWRPMRVTWPHLHNDPDGLDAEIRAALTASDD
jgi:very-short-patch-repair endonuclease